ncbi:EAL domain-containing protein [Comamonas sp. Y33R10-2]|uniref:putative bifunctional diguanylate cyclase/phosphodiesterase n=1 Tax=Comamonas sp. Y33R10-2 TaxID=2853257 RepID=UPI001C5C9C97|nr:EAL domain-containing protein [Comamonas sp. Y33R10-2]QXZ09506.1 EAL domain-containing protein [Comamonas sp. Y33R10-2]
MAQSQSASCKNPMAEAITERGMPAGPAQPPALMRMDTLLTRRERDALDAAPDGLLLVDREGRIVVANAAMEAISGFERQELEGHLIDRLLPADMHVKHRSYMQSYFARPSRRAMGLGGVLWMPRKQGGSVPVDIALGYFGDAQAGIAVAFVRDVTEINQMQQRLKFQATRDTLTGLNNRWQFGQELAEQIRLAQSSGESLALLQLDLDNFKAINDGYGHDAGDQLLKEVANRLKEQLRNDGLLARQGGDEFIVLLVGECAQRARFWSTQILAALATPFELEGLALDFGASIGIALYPENAQTGDDLLRFADIAMYCAKAQGRGHALFYEPSMGKEMAERVLLADRLRIALSYGGLQLHYQPQVDVRSGGIVGAEALLRWNDPMLGNISPARFIPVAEASGQIVALGNYVLDAACQQIALWLAEGTPLRVAVSLSAYQLRQSNLVELVHSCLLRHAVPAHWLELEVTESQAMQDCEHAKEVLGQLSRLGVTIALDDFGTGHSSLAYLQYLPVQRVKLGREFLFPSRHRTHLVGGILRMVHSLELEVVAEGVETQDQLELLQSLECNFFQGWLHSRAMPADQMQDCLKAA